VIKIVICDYCGATIHGKAYERIGIKECATCYHHRRAKTVNLNTRYRVN